MSAGVRVIVAFWNDEKGTGGVNVEGFPEGPDERTEGGDAGRDGYEGCFNTEAGVSYGSVRSVEGR